jgi:hypothetical protein
MPVNASVAMAFPASRRYPVNPFGPAAVGKTEWN